MLLAYDFFLGIPHRFFILSTYIIPWKSQQFDKTEICSTFLPEDSAG